MCCGQCVILLYSILLLPLLLMIIVLSDVCIHSNPSNALNSVLLPALNYNDNDNNNNDNNDIFFACTNPIETLFNSSVPDLKNMHTKLQDILVSPQVSGVTCPSSYHVYAMNKSVANIYMEPSGIFPNYINAFRDIDMNCPTYKPLYNDIIENNICSSM